MLLNGVAHPWRLRASLFSLDGRERCGYFMARALRMLAARAVQVRVVSGICRKLVQLGLDTLGGILSARVLPEPKHGPARGEQILISATISFLIGGKLCLPPISVRARGRSVQGARVPEAPVDEHSQSCPRKDDVNSASIAQNASVDEESTTTSVELASESHFDRRVLGPYSCHACARCRVHVHVSMVR